MSQLSGELSFVTVPALLAQAGALASAETLDLAQVTRIDSAGAALLLELSRRAKDSGRTLTISHAGPQVLSLIRFLELDEVLSLKS